MKLLLVAFLVMAADSFSKENNLLVRNWLCSDKNQVIETYYGFKPGAKKTNDGIVIVKYKNDYYRILKFLVQNVEVKVSSESLPCQTTLKYNSLNSKSIFTINHCDKNKGVLVETTSGTTYTSELNCISVENP